MTDNPYAPPKSLVADVGPDGAAGLHAGSKRRPFLVWLIVVPAGLGYLSIPLIVYALIHYWALLPEETQSILRRITHGDALTTGILTVLHAIGIIQLFRMKRSAFQLYTASLVLGTIRTLANHLTGGTNAGSWIGLMASFAFSFMVWWYVWCLYRKKMLT